jgi:dTDP-4-dehydrorhamnose 3,5-epimerase
LLWNDSILGIKWPFAGEPELAKKDAEGKLLADAEVFE